MEKIKVSEKRLLKKIKGKVVFTGELAKHFKVSKHVILDRIRRLKKRYRVKVRFGKRIKYRYKIEKIVEELGYKNPREYFLINGFKTFREMAEELGMSYQTVSNNYNHFIRGRS